VQKSKQEIHLPPVVRLVLHHGPGPLPCRYGRIPGSDRPSDPLLRGERSKQGHGLVMTAIMVGQDRVQTFGQPGPVTGIRGWTPVHRFGVHPALDSGEMPYRIA
jgi:hypothetical protein